MADVEVMSLDAATALIEAALRSNGVSDDTAASVGRALVAAEAEGQAGHGFSRLEDYIAQAQSGKINPKARVRVEVPQPARVEVDADFGFAYPALDAAVEAGIAAAQRCGIASMAVRRSHHCGALSVQVARLAEAGLIGLMVANTPAAIAPWGAKEAVFGTNPIAFAAPRAGQDPLVIDLSLSKVARGKVMHAKKSGVSIPADWALDAQGLPTTDPEAALGGSMMPIGEAKGTALALVVEILAAVLTSSALSHDASSFFNPDGPPPGVGQFLLAIAPGDSAGFAQRLEGLLTLIDGLEGARLPGARRAQAIANAKAEGIAVPVAYLQTARRLAGA